MAFLRSSIARSRKTGVSTSPLRNEAPVGARPGSEIEITVSDRGIALQSGRHLHIGRFPDSGSPRALSIVTLSCDTIWNR